MRKANRMRLKRIRLKNCKSWSSVSCPKDSRVDSRTRSSWISWHFWRNKNERKQSKRIMKASTILAASVVVAASLLPFCARAQEGTDPSSRQVQLKKGDRIIFFGDSLTALAIKDSNVPEGKGYVPVVRAALKDRGVEVDAVATGGHKVTDLLKRVDQDVISN